MAETKKSEKPTTRTIKFGTPWKILASFDTFEEADDLRKNQQGDGRQAKVFHKIREGVEKFQVRYRDLKMSTSYEASLKKKGEEE